MVDMVGLYLDLSILHIQYAVGELSGGQEKSIRQNKRQYAVGGELSVGAGKKHTRQNKRLGRN